MLDLKSLSINDLITKLHQTIIGFVEGMESVLEMNRQYSEDEIERLRSILSERLRAGQEDADNKKLIGLLDLLSRDRAVLNLVKKDAEEWVEMLDAIEDHMKGRPGSIGGTDAKKIAKLTGQLKTLIRKTQ